MKRKEVFAKLAKSYFFSTLAQKRAEYEKSHEGRRVISLGIGDAVLPLVPALKTAFDALSDELATNEGFVGYGDSQGLLALREKLATNYYKGGVDADEVFISNGAKGQLAQLQNFFSHAISVGIVTPTYPVYADGSRLQGISQIHALPLTQENQFYYDLEKTPKMDLVYLCYPNNPTGTVMSKEQLTKWVKVCKERGILMIVDVAYSAYIDSEKVCKSIYEIPGAKEVAIEIGSYSKSLGFSGVRGGWITMPKALRYVTGESIYEDWSRFHATTFNGAALFSQKGMLASFAPEAIAQVKAQSAYYMENAKRLKKAFEKLGFTTYGGEDAPYVWVSLGRTQSWDFFNRMLQSKQLVITPGVGFGEEGEYFARLSAFLTKEDMDEVEARLFESATPLDGATLQMSHGTS